MAKCGSCGGGAPVDQVQIVVRADGTEFEVSSPTEARIKIAVGDGKRYYAKKK